MAQLNYWSRSRMSRRGLIRSAGVLGTGLSTAALLGCSSSPKETVPVVGTAASADAPVAPSGELRLATSKLTEPFDPAIMVSAGTAHWGLFGNIAIHVNKQNYKLEPALVESWEVKSPTEIALKVRQGVLFHDKAPTNGRALNAEDVAYSLNKHAGLLDPAKAALYPRRTNFTGMTKAEAVDKSTVVLRMSAPNSAILNGIADRRVSMMAVETKDTGFVDPNKLTGTGPWVIDRIDDNGAGTYTANRKYWEKGMPKAATITRQYFETSTAALAGFLADTHDLGDMTNLPYSEIQKVAERRPDAKRLEWDYGRLYFARFNTKKAPFTDERVRRAMRLAIDVKPIGDGFFGPLWGYSGPLVSTWKDEAISADEIKTRPGWNPSTRDKDVDEAKKLMAAAGFPEGELNISFLVFNTPVHPANSERARAQWSRIWPRMKITLDGPLDSGPMFARVGNGGFDIMSYSIQPSPDAAVDFQTFYANDGSRNYGKYADAAVDKLSNQALGEFDLAARGRILKQAQEIVIQQSPIVPYFFAKQVVFVNPKWEGIDGYGGPGGQGANDIIEGVKVVGLKK